MVMIASLLQNALEALKAQVCIIDADGTIQFVNESWRAFGLENGMLADYDWQGVNYFVSSNAVPLHTEIRYAISRIQKVARGDRPYFETEYPCDSPTKRRWFLMTAAHFECGGKPYCVITHTDITHRKLIGEKAEFLAHVDPLTNLANRRAMETFLNQQCDGAMLNQKSLSVLMIDIDHFKSINDEHGHLFGDHCLKQIAKLITESIRESTDLVARYGGEEFVAILPDVPLDEALKRAELIAHLIRSASFDFENKLLKLTVSIGVFTGTPVMDIPNSSFIQKADFALLKAKKSGRNRVMQFDA